jgi:TonB family protein
MAPFTEKESISRYGKQPNYQSYGVLFSFASHIVLLLLVLNVQNQEKRAKTAQVVYSVSLESGMRLGGMSQVGTKPDQQNAAPPKVVKQTAAVEKPTPPPVVKKQDVKPVPVKEVPKPKVEDADVSLATPKPSATPTPVATVKPTVAPTVKPTAAPTPVPTVAATPAPTAVETPKETPSAAPSATPDSTAKKQAAAKANSSVTANQNFEDAMQRYLGNSVNAGGQGFGSTGQGGKGMGGGVQKPAEWILYKNRVETMVKQGFNWHDRSTGLLVLVRFAISPTGVVSNVRVIESSGTQSYDLAGVRAVQKASPLPPPPGKFYSDFAEVEMELRPY